MDRKKAKIIIAAHKEYQMPEDSIYLPLHVGAEGKTDEEGNPLSLGYLKDNTGDNISFKNPMYCELTGLYWAWKNLDADYIGLAHYRRHFLGKGKGKDKFQRVLRGKELRFLINKGYRVIVPRKRNYYIESLYSHYVHTYRADELDETREIIERIYPEYIESYDTVLARSSGYMFNMMIMERELVEDYCSWLFTILDELVERVDDSEMTDFEKRYPGRVSEILFNVWLDRKIACGDVQEDEIAELPFIYMEKVNKIKKGTAFLKAKFLHKGYEKSF
ncbi:MAG: DUF4422 domain-containing protein [Eubacterium sp.]|nr:DUF4422 domain-containing protein [Eubacterium sp.]SEF84427.1 hypothetical protein SAMN04487934_10433 [Eubacterium ruminantium]